MRKKLKIKWPSLGKILFIPLVLITGLGAFMVNFPHLVRENPLFSGIINTVLFQMLLENVGFLNNTLILFVIISIMYNIITIKIKMDKVKLKISKLDRLKKEITEDIKKAKNFESRKLRRRR